MSPPSHHGYPVGLHILVLLPLTDITGISYIWYALTLGEPYKYPKSKGLVNFILNITSNIGYLGPF